MKFNDTPKIETKERILLPEDFTIKLSGDFTSSGADRDYNATLVFSGGKLVSGDASLYIGQTDGKQLTYIVKLIDDKWIDTKTNEVCIRDFSNFNSITKEGLEDEINSDTIKPKGEFRPHAAVVYELI